MAITIGDAVYDFTLQPIETPSSTIVATVITSRCILKRNIKASIVCRVDRKTEQIEMPIELQVVRQLVKSTPTMVHSRRVRADVRLARRYRQNKRLQSASIWVLIASNDSSLSLKWSSELIFY